MTDVASVQNGHGRRSPPDEPDAMVNGLDSIFQTKNSKKASTESSEPECANNGPCKPNGVNSGAASSDEGNEASSPENTVDEVTTASTGSSSRGASTEPTDNESSKVDTGCESLDKLFATDKKRREFVSQLLSDIMTTDGASSEKNATGVADAISYHLKAFIIAVAGGAQAVDLDTISTKIRDLLALPDQITIPPSDIVSIMSVTNFEPAEKRSVDKPVSDSANSPCFPCPAMTSLLMDIGLNLVMESHSMTMYEKVSKDVNTNGSKLNDVKKHLDDLQMGAEPEDSDSEEEAGTIESSKKLKSKLEDSLKSLTNTKQMLKTNIHRLKEENRPLKLKYAKCGKCEFRSESLSVMYHHMLHPHKKLNRLECGFCDYRVGSLDDIEAHYQDEHSLPCYEYLYPAKLVCEHCPRDDFTSKGELKVHTRACSNHNPLRQNMAPIEDDLLHINRLFWSLNDFQLRRIQQKMFASRKQAAQQATAKNNAVAAARLVGPRSGVSGAAGLSGRPADVRQVRPPGYQMIGQKPIVTTTPRYPVPIQPRGGARTIPPIVRPGFPQPSLRVLYPRSVRGRPPGPVTVATNLAAAAADARVQQAKANAARSGQTRVYQCEICDDVQMGFSQYSIHLQSVHGKHLTVDQHALPPLSCSKCVNQRFYSYEGLERHLLSTHNLVSQELLRKAREKKDNGRCKVCAKSFAAGLVQHCASVHKMPLCTADIVYTCDICKAKFTVYAQLEQHLATVHKRGTKPLTPVIPFRNIGRPSKLLAGPVPRAAAAGNPQAGQPPRIRYNCTPCQLKFVTYGEVIEHWRVRHLKQFTVPTCKIEDCDPCKGKRKLEPLPDSESDNDEPEAKRVVTYRVGLTPAPPSGKKDDIICLD